MVLYYSKWDKYSAALMEELEVWKGKEGGEVLYTINSWDLPHAFMAFRVTSVPTLIYTFKGRVRTEKYLPRIYNHFNRRKARRNRAS